MTRQTLNIRIGRYAYPRVEARREVAARIIGALAVHPPAFWGDGDESQIRTLKGWTVSHAASGLNVLGFTPWWHNNSRAPTRADLIEWAEWHQRECADFYAALLGADADGMSDETKQLAPAARDRGRTWSPVEKD